MILTNHWYAVDNKLTKDLCFIYISEKWLFFINFLLRSPFEYQHLWWTFFCCVPHLPQLACSILATWERPYSRALYLTDGTAEVTSMSQFSMFFRGHIWMNRKMHIMLKSWWTTLQPPCGPAGVHDDACVCGPGSDGLHLGALANLLAPRDHVPEGHDLGVAGEPGDWSRFDLKIQNSPY